MKVFKLLHIPTAKYVKIYDPALDDWVDIEHSTLNYAKSFLIHNLYRIYIDRDSGEIRREFCLIRPEPHVPKHEISIVEVEHESDLLTGHKLKNVS